MHLRAVRLCAFAIAFAVCSWPFRIYSAPSNDLRAFFGQIATVNHATKTISLHLGDTLVFHVTNETMISSAAGGAIPFDKLRPGDGALVTVRPGPGKTGVAVKILVVPGTTFPGDYSARTIKGETISGAAFANYVLFQPPPLDINRGINFGMSRSGIFLLSVRPDGSVENVKTVRTLGYSDLDERAIAWLKKWRFRPNSLAEVRIPISYHRTR